MLLTICIITLAGTLVGSICGIGVALVVERNQFLMGALSGAIFGTWVGLVLGVLFGTIRRLRESCANSRSRAAVLFILPGSLAGAALFSLFSEGIAMALYLAVEGVLAGGVIGFFLSLFVPRFWAK